MVDVLRIDINLSIGIDQFKWYIPFKSYACRMWLALEVSMDIPFVVSREVGDAVAEGRPVVALETVAIAFGFPRPMNFEMAQEFEAMLREMDVVPATIAVIDGVAKVGLSTDDLRRMSEDKVHKASVRDLPILIGKKLSAATTIAGTAWLAYRAGISVFAAEGLGGVHPATDNTVDESADLFTLATTPITLVSSGVKSLLDIGATLERLDTLSVPVVGYRTNRFPRFWVSESEFELDWTVESPEEVVGIMQAQRQLGLGAGMLVANPVPQASQLDPVAHDNAIAEAIAVAAATGIAGKQVTPFIMDRIVAATGGQSVNVNREMICVNIRLAGQIAKSWSLAQKSQSSSRS